MSATTPRTDPDQTDLRRIHLRTAGIAALVGVVLIGIDNAILGNPPRDDAFASMTYVAERPWFISRMVGLIGVLAWLASFTALARTLRSPIAASVARLAQPVLTVAVAVFAVQYAHDGFSLASTATHLPDAGRPGAELEARAETLNLLIGGASILAQSLLGLGLACYALAVLLSRECSRIVGWWGVIAAGGWFLTAGAHFMQLPGTTFEIILPFAGLTAAWVVALAVSALRRSRATTPERTRT